VIRPLVPDLCEKDPALGGICIDLGLLTLRLGTKPGKIALSRFFSTATILEPVRRPTILLNEAGV
jgi:hypothetical protein